MSLSSENLKDYDFSGWATRNNLRCADGRTILENAFKHNDGQIVPLVWMHNHEDPSKVLGHALLKNEKEGVRAYCKFNNTDSANYAKELVHNGDIKSLSIYANQLKQKANGNGLSVYHGDIKEVSLVLAGANPGAHIDSEIIHGEFSDESAFIRTGYEITIAHSDNGNVVNAENEPKNSNNNDDETLADVFDTLSEKQKNAVYAIVGQALEDGQKPNDNKNNPEGGNNSMKHNVFDNENNQNDVLAHSAEAIFAEARRGGRLSDAYNAYIEHAETDGTGTTQDPVPATPSYGIENIDYLFPEARSINGVPEFIKRENDWVINVMGGVHHTPFARIKSMFADITKDAARAKGYMKGNRKEEEVFSLLKRETTPTTVYKKQKADRDDIIDISDFDVVAWIKAEMRLMLDEEFARAYLFGDGRLSSDNDKINENNIRPIITDDSLFTIKAEIAGSTKAEIAANAIDDVVRAQDDYQGSGSLTAYIKREIVTEMLLIKNADGERMYKNLTDLATAMSVDKVVRVPNAVVPKDYYGVVVDLKDYNVGADKGGAVNLFDDFDIDYNQYKYLIESRCSGALTKPYSAIALKKKTA